MIPEAHPKTFDEALALLRENLTEKEKAFLSGPDRAFTCAYIHLLNMFHLYDNVAIVDDIERMGIRYHGCGPIGEFSAGILLDMIAGKSVDEIAAHHREHALKYGGRV